MVLPLFAFLYMYSKERSLRVNTTDKRRSLITDFLFSFALLCTARVEISEYRLVSSSTIYSSEHISQDKFSGLSKFWHGGVRYLGEDFEEILY